ncbi:MAG TPA: hypothetical protein VG871_09545 [Vicinamibacterales bacterium]|nr:hypothetical protein [Vicinamibacterales bacterium]
MVPAAATPPRWEWRAFGDAFPALDAALDAVPCDLRASSEIYIVCAEPDVNAKVRGGQIDVKQRLRVEDGLELWSPVLKAPFPLDQHVIAAAFRLWRLPLPQLSRAAYTLPQFLDDVVAAAPGLVAVDVAKERRGASLDGSFVEVAALTVRGEAVRTAGIEAEDPERVRRAVRTLGLSSHANESYPQALRRMLRAHPAPQQDSVREGASP